MSGTRSARVALGLAVVLCGGAGIEAYQGMASSKRPTRRVKAIETDLPPITVDFRDVAVEAGLIAPQRLGRGEREKKYILETTGSGVAIFDFDGDGWMDVFLGNGTTLDGEGGGRQRRPAISIATSADCSFQDVTRSRRASARVGWGQGACVRRLRQRRRRRPVRRLLTARACSIATRAAAASRTSRPRPACARAAARWDTGCSWFDYDLDGRLDLVVTSYLEFDRTKVPEPGSRRLLPVEGHPRDVRAARPALLAQRPLPQRRPGTLHGRVGGERDRPPRELLRFHRRGLRLRQRRLSRPLRRLRLDAQPALPQPARRHVRGDRAPRGRRPQRGRPGAGRHGRGGGRLRRGRPLRHREDELQRRRAERLPQQRRRHVRGPRASSPAWAAYMEYVGWGVHLLDVDHDGRARPAHGQRPRLPGGRRRRPSLRYRAAAPPVLERRRRAVQGHLGGGRARLSTRPGRRAGRPPAISTTTARSRSWSPTWARARAC